MHNHKLISEEEYGICELYADYKIRLHRFVMFLLVFMGLGFLMTLAKLILSLANKDSFLTDWFGETNNSWPPYVLMCIGTGAWEWLLFKLHKAIDLKDNSDSLKDLKKHFMYLIMIFLFLMFYLQLRRSFQNIIIMGCYCMEFILIWYLDSMGNALHEEAHNALEQEDANDDQEFKMKLFSPVTSPQNQFQKNGKHQLQNLQLPNINFNVSKKEQELIDELSQGDMDDIDQMPSIKATPRNNIHQPDNSDNSYDSDNSDEENSSIG